MELRDALAQITEIRSQIARNETFRGYRSATVGFSGLLALAGAAAQARWMARPGEDLTAYLALWIGVAAVSLAVVGAEMAARSYWYASPLARQLTLLAVEQFLPSLVAGGLLTGAVAWYAPESAWLLPGLWAIVFSLGVFASCRFLPSLTILVAVYYLIGGVAALALARGDAAFSPWAMAGNFGGGQLLGAAILYFTLERNDGKT
jgi:formate/nitrite transporter FocA (FNT family)